jgi:N-acetylglucosamine malate deacetylase 1
MKNKVLVISAHPDDEVLGCGGTLANHYIKGDEIHQIFVSDGEGARLKRGKSLIKDINSRIKLAKKVAKILGISKTKSLNFEDNQLDKIPLLKIIKKLENEIEKFKPNIIYTHSDIDLNIDHQIVSRAVLTACRPIKSTVKEINFFEILSSTEWSHKSFKSFNPNYFVDISKTINLKLKAIKVYQKELRNFPHPRSILGVKTLSKYRGMMSGLKEAEGFYIKRKIY